MSLNVAEINYISAIRGCGRCLNDQPTVVSNVCRHGLWVDPDRQVKLAVQFPARRPPTWPRLVMAGLHQQLPVHCLHCQLLGLEV
jgi:hypothetical protein